MTVYFVDTSVFCNLLPIPGRDQHRAEVLAELQAKQQAQATLILPVAAVIEASNFIAQLSNGGERRQTAEKFRSLLRMICDDAAPWRLHQFTWGSEFLESFIAGAGTGMDIVGHAVGGLGGGDLTILTERQAYKARTGLHDVQIWARDAVLEAYA